MFDPEKSEIDSFFQIFSDENRTLLTPYNRDNKYLKNHAVRIHAAYKTIKNYVRSGSRVLDVGGSPFYMAYLLSKYNNSTVDVIFYSTDKHPLRNNSKAYYNGGHINLIFKNIENDNFIEINKKYNVVITMECLEHLNFFPFSFFESVKSSLRTGGILYITVPNVSRASNVYKLITNRNIYNAYRPDSSGRHKREYTLKEVLNILADCLNFEIIHTKTILVHNKFRELLLYRIISLGGILKFLFPIIEVVGKKTNTSNHIDWEKLNKNIYQNVLSLEL